MPKPELLIRQLSSVPSDPAAFDKWLDETDAIAFLRANLASNEVVLHASAPHVYLHSVLVPSKVLDDTPLEELEHWHLDADATWGVSQTFSPARVYLTPPFDFKEEGAEPLIYRRAFEAHLEHPTYYELDQKFMHVSSIHFVPERQAYCRIDELGDIEDVVRVIRTADDTGGGTVITCLSEVLDQYMTLTGTVLLRKFDFTRYRPGDFNGWPSITPTAVLSGDLAYHRVVLPGHASYAHGVQIGRSRLTESDLIATFDVTRQKDRKYDSFVAVDWKNKKLTDISTKPGATANYFTKSDLPFETSPAFFKPEVLQKYKADSDKYRLEDRSISCRGAWHLQTYDINDAGQVHTYIVYLRGLPYQEQLHWKAYNEPPNGGISSRAFKSDFEGHWDLEYDPLASLRSALGELTAKGVPWWHLRSGKLPDQVHYPVTASADEWATEILHLDQFVVEGFVSQWLRTHAESLGAKPEAGLGSLKLVEECLTRMGFDLDAAREVTAPLHELHYMRSKLKGHAQGEEATKLKRDALTKHGTYKDHYKHLCARCDQAVRTISKTFGVALATFD